MSIGTEGERRRLRDIVPRSARGRTLVVFGAFVLAILVAIWSLPGFLVQDSPLYLYNTHLIRELLRPSSPYHEYFVLDWRPLPYWGAYGLLAGLMQVMPPRVADQVLMSLTSVGVAAAVLWLRVRIVGWQGGAVVAPLVILLCINLVWMLGIHNFLLGEILYFVTLAWWWRTRDRLGARDSAVLAVLLVAGYFCHLVSFGLTALGVGTLALLTPGPHYRRRLLWTALSIMPTVPLVFSYFQVMGAAGETTLHWRGLTSALSPGAWLTYAFMADFPTIHEHGMSGSTNPFVQMLFIVPPPSRWALIGLTLLLGGSVLRRTEEDGAYYRLHLGWIVLAAVLIAGGVLGPADVGETQVFLRERPLLLGFATLVPVLRVNVHHALSRAGAALLMLAAVAQVILLWDYALKSDRLVGDFLKARPYAGTNQGIAAAVELGPWPYRVSPLIHAANLLGLYSGNVIWNNPNPAFHFFPVKYRKEDQRRLSLLVGNRAFYEGLATQEQQEMARTSYRAMMARSHAWIDVLLLWSESRELDSISAEWFAPPPLYDGGRTRILRRVQ